jgi:hypothetical protein
MHHLRKIALARRFEWIPTSSAPPKMVAAVGGHPTSSPLQPPQRHRQQQRHHRDPSTAVKYAPDVTHQLYGPLYDGTRRGRHWWFLAEIAVSVTMGLASGLVGVDREEAVVLAASVGDMSGLASCKVIPWFLVAVAVIFFVVTMFVSPYDRGVDQGLLVLLASFTAVSSVIAAIPYGATDDGADVTFGLDIASNALSIAVLLCDLAELRFRWVSQPPSTQTAQSLRSPVLVDRPDEAWTELDRMKSRASARATNGGRGQPDSSASRDPRRRSVDALKWLVRLACETRASRQGQSLLPSDHR